MNYIKQFESFNSKDILDKVDDIAAYMPTSTTKVSTKLIPTTFDTKKIIDDNAYSRYDGPLEYIRYYTFGFDELNKFFMSESEIRNRSNSYGLKFIILNFKSDSTPRYMILFFLNEDWSKLNKADIISNVEKSRWDVLFEEDVKIDKSEFDIIYEDDDIMAVKPNTYKAAIKYSSDSNWKAAFRKNKEWIEKYITKSSYYGGYNWYKSVTKKDVQNWWSKLVKSKSDTQVKDFVNDYPRYLLYIVIFKNVPSDDDMNKLFLLYDVSRSEYGELPRSFSSGYFLSGYAGDMLDAAHNQVKVVKSNGHKTTLRDIHGRHGSLFNRAFREIEYDFNEEKERLYNLLGIWSDIGGEYRDDALIFIRSTKEPDRLQITKPSLLKKQDDGSISWIRLGYYDDEQFDYWDLAPKPQDKVIPNDGKGYKDYFDTIRDNTKVLRDALSDKGLL